MFPLVHFSRVFPYIHPDLFPSETAQSAPPDPGPQASPGSPEPVGATAGTSSAEDTAISVSTCQSKCLKYLHRCHLRNQRKDLLTYSGAQRCTAW